MKKTKVAFVYDFDETLSTTYMQDYFLIPELGMKPNDFWKEANKLRENNKMDQVLTYMYLIMDRKTRKMKTDKNKQWKDNSAIIEGDFNTSL